MEPDADRFFLYHALLGLLRGQRSWAGLGWLPATLAPTSVIHLRRAATGTDSMLTAAVDKVRVRICLLTTSGELAQKSGRLSCPARRAFLPATTSLLPLQHLLLLVPKHPADPAATSV